MPNNSNSVSSSSTTMPSLSSLVVDMDCDAELHSSIIVDATSSSLFDSSYEDDGAASLHATTDFSNERSTRHSLEVSSDGHDRPDLYQENDTGTAGPRILKTPVVFSRNHDDMSSLLEDDATLVVQAVRVFNDALDHHSQSKLCVAMEMYQACVNTVVNVLEKQHSPCCLALLEIGMRAHNNIGQMVYAEGNDLTAEAHFQASLLFSKQLQCTLENRQNQDLEYSTILSNKCRVMWTRGQVSCDTLYTDMQDVLRIRSCILPWNHSDVAASHYNLAALEFTRMNFPTAVEHLMQYLKVAADRIRTSGQENDLDVIPALSYLLLIQNAQVEDCSTSQVLLRGISILLGNQADHCDKVLPVSHEVANILNGIASLLYKKGNLEMSLLFFQEELRVDEELFRDNNHMCVSITCYNIGRVLQELSNYEQAISSYERALQPVYGNERAMMDYDSCRTLPASKADMLSISKISFLSTIWYNLGILHDKLASRDQAIRAFDIALELKKSVLGSDYADIACLNFNIGVLLMEENSPDAASKYLEQVLGARRQYLEMTGRCMEKLSDALCVRTLQKLALMYKNQSANINNHNIQAALNTLREVLRILINSTEFDSTTRIKDMALVLRSISEHYHTLGDLPSALVAARDSVRELELFARMAMDNGSRTTAATAPSSLEEKLAMMEHLVTSLLLLGSLYHEMCEPMEAHAVHQQALTMIKLATEFSPLPSTCPDSLRNICELAILLGTTPYAPSA